MRSRAPLRLGFAGGGSDLSPYCDLHGGYVMNATINLFAYAHLCPSPDGIPRFVAADRCVQQELRVSGEAIDPSLALHKGVYDRICREFCAGERLPVQLTTHSDVPPGSGLGSSSTLVVAIVDAFREYLNLPLGEYDIARLAFEIERRDVGFPGGRQDQYAATFGGFNFMEFSAHERVIVNPLRIRTATALELEASLLICTSNVPRDSDAVIREQSSNIQTGDEEAVTATHELKREALSMKEALLKGDLKQFANALANGWLSKKRTSRSVSNPKLEQLHQVAIKAGATAGKVSGAGGGGYMLFFIEPTKRPNVVRELEQIGCRVHPVHFTDAGVASWRAG